MVAVTEAGEAYCSGEAVMVKDLMSKGLEMEKHWLVTGGRICPICQNNDGEGWIPAETAFSSGHDHPLAHPACRCATQYRLKREDRRTEVT